MFIEYIPWVIAGVIASIATWILVRSRRTVGPEYDEMREDLEKVRHEMKEAEALGATEFEGKRFDASIQQFNRLAKRLRVEEY